MPPEDNILLVQVEFIIQHRWIRFCISSHFTALFPLVIMCEANTYIHLTRLEEQFYILQDSGLPSPL